MSLTPMQFSIFFSFLINFIQYFCITSIAVPKTVNTEKLNNRLISYLDDDSPAHDRKVKFNELVEQIEVIEESDSEAPKDPELPETRRY